MVSVVSSKMRMVSEELWFPGGHYTTPYIVASVLIKPMFSPQHTYSM